MEDIIVGQIISGFILVLGFSLQILGAALLKCLSRNDKEMSWCKENIELDGVFALIGGMFALIVFSLLAQCEQSTGCLINSILTFR